jgi:hypothetical protein
MMFVTEARKYNVVCVSGISSSLKKMYNVCY